MPKLSPRKYPATRVELLGLAVSRMEAFCAANGVTVPPLRVVSRDDWHVNTCAYYRQDTPATKKYTHPGINICLEYCGTPCGQENSRNWSWPGSTVDRTVYGVVLHELGHHLDWMESEVKGEYYGNYGVDVGRESGEDGLTSYANTNPAEWFAEAARLFITNPDLLRCTRYRTWQVLGKRYKPVPAGVCWKDALGSDVPPRVVAAQRNKGAR